MKNVFKLFRQLSDYKNKIALYFLFSLLSVFFALFSFTMLAPVLQLLFVGKESLPNSGSGIIARLTNIINNLIDTQGKLNALLIVIIVVIVATILKNLCLYLAALILNPIKNGVIRNIRDNLFGKITEIPIGYFTEEKKGDLMSRMTNDVSLVESSIVSALQTVIREPITILLTIAYMVYISPYLTLFLIIFLPIVGLIIGRVGVSLKKPSNMAQEKLGVLLGIIDETLSGMRILKAFNAERIQWLHFRKNNNKLFRLQNRILARQEAASPVSETLGILVVCIILLYGGWLIFTNQSTTLTGPWFIAYIGLFYQIIQPIKKLSSASYNMEKGSAALDRISQFLAVENTVKEKENTTTITNFKEKIEFNAVDFSYGNRQALCNINFEIPKGQMVALVGTSGAGKSTIADLILRFHDVTRGAILIDGKDLRDLSVHDLRKLMGLVSQEPILFNDTIYNNITLGVGGATEEQVIEAAKIANAHRFIMGKNNGYQTMAGDRGVKLSGGEKQRITIARAVLKNPPILILDEATSSLDTESEQIVQRAINELMKNRTSLVIAHRLSTIQNADKIIVLNQGHIVETGTHEQLMAQNGDYKKLVGMQQIK